MAKMNAYDREHLQNLSMYQRMIDAIYAKASEEAAKIAASVRNVDTDKAFKFSDYPQTKKQVDMLMKSLQSRIQVTIVNGIDAEWTLANNKNNELANRVFGDKAKSLSKAEERRYYSTNDNARQAFQQRKINGLSLSDRVWKYTDQFKEEIEMGLDVGIRNGVAADKMAGELKQYLRHPDKLFRRVRDERGQLHLSQAAKAFHPGRGVYRSSYMNARRLAATETNMAYRSSDFMRWQQMDFVVGIEIQLSNNHTCKGSDGKPHEFHDICDELKGRYPKDFKFTGFHPHCRCRAISILKTQKEIAEDTKKILNGEKPDTDSVNEVKDVPPAFKKYLQDNADRIAAAEEKGTVAYFIKDNPKFVDAALEINPTNNISENIIKQSGHIGDSRKLEDKGKIDLIIKETGVSEEKAAEFNQSVFDYSYGWDSEIRAYQMGNLDMDKVRQGHSLEKIEHKAKLIEEFISLSPKWDGGVTYRGMAMSDQNLQSLREQLNTGTAGMRGTASWSTDEDIADFYANRNKTEATPNLVILVTQGHKSATSIMHLSKYAHEYEVLASIKCRYKFVREEFKRGIYYIYVQPT